MKKWSRTTRGVVNSEENAKTEKSLHGGRESCFGNVTDDDDTDIWASHNTHSKTKSNISKHHLPVFLSDLAQLDFVNLLSSL